MKIIHVAPLLHLRHHAERLLIEAAAVSFDYTHASLARETAVASCLGILTNYETHDTQSLELNETHGGAMAIVGYRRVSSDGQNLLRQDIECDKLFEEAASGGSRDRPALAAMIDYVREGDEIRVWSIDRLARDLRDLQDIIQTVTAKGASIAFLSERLTFSGNSDDPFAKLQLQMMGAFAEFERSIIRKRQAEGIAKAKERGVYKGRRPTIDLEAITELKQQGLGATEIAKRLGIGRASVYRVMNSKAA